MITTFLLYEFGLPNSDKIQKILLRLSMPLPSNNNLAGQELAETVLEHKRDEILRQLLQKKEYTEYKLIGRFELSPEGDSFYEEQGGFEVEFWYIPSGYGEPWAIISQADSEADFYRMLQEEEDWQGMRPLPPAKAMKALFYTEKDFDLSAFIGRELK